MRPFPSLAPPSHRILECADERILVTGEREQKSEHSDDRFYRFERRYGTFTRTIALPQGVSEDLVKAEYSDGVLEVRVPKPEQSKPRRIQVGSGPQAALEGEAKKK